MHICVFIFYYELNGVTLRTEIYGQDQKDATITFLNKQKVDKVLKIEFKESFYI